MWQEMFVMGSGALQSALEVQKHGQVWQKDEPSAACAQSTVHYYGGTFAHAAWVPDSHWICQSDALSDNGLVIFQAVQDASSPGDAEKVCNVYSIH